MSGRRPRFHRLRKALALWLVGLLLIGVAAPCTALAASVEPAFTAALDPCKADRNAPCPICIQAACNVFVAPARPDVAAPRRIGCVAFVIFAASACGLTDRPDLPPPRLSPLI